jgi:hypothetical protein
VAARLAAADGVEVLNDVVLNQVLVRFASDDEATNAVTERTQQDGTCWLSGSSFRGQAVMRVSVSSGGYGGKTSHRVAVSSSLM